MRVEAFNVLDIGNFQPIMNNKHYYISMLILGATIIIPFNSY